MTTDRSKKKGESGMGTKSGVLTVRGEGQERERDLGRGKKGCTQDLPLIKISTKCLQHPVPHVTCARAAQGAGPRPQTISQVRVTLLRVILIA